MLFQHLGRFGFHVSLRSGPVRLLAAGVVSEAASSVEDVASQKKACADDRLELPVEEREQAEVGR